VKGASSMPITKAMDDCLIAYGMNGEALRPQQGFPVRLIPPRLEGIFHTKYLRRIRARPVLHELQRHSASRERIRKSCAQRNQSGPKSVITYPSGGAAARPRILRDQRLLAAGAIPYR